MKEQCQKKYQSGLKKRTALDDLWSLEKKTKESKIHNSQVAGPSHRISQFLCDDSSDSTVQEESNEGRDYDTIHPPSPKISKGGIVKKSRKQPIMQDMSNTHNASLIDIHTSAGHNGDTDNRKSESEENVAYDCDVAMQVSTGNITEQMTNRDELSSDVDIAPSGIVARANDEYESDEGYLAVPQNSAGSMPNKGNYIWNRVITKII